ncbi:MAG: hypothetical protein R2709_14900 [Marmoricola sp.]
MLSGEVAPGLPGSVVHGTASTVEVRLHLQVRHVQIPSKLSFPALLGTTALVTSSGRRSTEPTQKQQRQADRLHH